MYSLTQCHEEQCYSVGVLTDKTLYSTKLVQEKKAPGWHNIKRIKDIPDVCTVCTGLQAQCNATGVTQNSRPPGVGLEFSVSGNDFERNIIITLAQIAPEPIFFYRSYKNIELPTESKFRPYSKLPKKTFNNLNSDAAPIYPGEESTEEEDNLIGELV